MRLYKSQDIENFEYVLIDEYFISDDNLYFIGNNEVYSVDLNDDLPNHAHSELENVITRK